MDKENLKYYKLIALIQSVIRKSESYYDAVKNGIRIITEHSGAEYAIVWHREGAALHPYYWLSPSDLTSSTLSAEMTVLRDCLQEDKSAILFDFTREAPQELRQTLQNIEIRSLVITPLRFSNTDQGLVFFFSSADTITEDEANVIEILSMLTEMMLGESQYSFRPWQDRKTIMSCRDLHKSFQNGDTVTQVLNGVNLDVYEGEFLCLLGESGCGKSTFLNVIGGLERADFGTFSFMDREYQNASEDELTEYRRKNIGFVFQSYNLMPNLTSIQNLDLIAELVEDPMDSAEALDIVGLSEKRNSYPSQLSGGQQQRVSIARAIVKRPKLIMADEPTAALDYATSIEVLQAMADVVKQGTTLIMVTHNEEITRMADRVIRFRNGKTFEITINHHPAKAEELRW